MLGDEQQCHRMIAVLIVAWRILGISLAFAKGQWGDRIDWIGASLSIESDCTLAITIVRARLEELSTLCKQLLQHNTVSLRSVRSFTGKCQSMASVLYTWRPFVYTMYGAMNKPPTNLPAGLLYTRQIQQSVTWIQTFLAGKRGDLVRVMNVDAHYRRGTMVDIIVDTSPWGIGAILSLDGVPWEYFAVATTAEDAQHLGLEISRDSKCQQAFEALAMLIALRHWRYVWAHTRCCIRVKGDSMAALALITKMQTHSYSPVSYTHLTLPTKA